MWSHVRKARRELSCKSSRVVLLLLLLLAAACAEAAIELEDCTVSHPRLPQVISAVCGTLSVPENHPQPATGKIELHLAVIKAKSRDVSPDPVFFIAGGPGQSAIRTAVMLQAVFKKVSRQRDVVLIDQRGTGRSNPLDCPPPDLVDMLFADDTELLNQARACLTSIKGSPRFYTTDQAVEDLEMVRAALDYDKINLLGVSYGTRVAQHYLRSYPDQVRSIVLDGIAPPDLLLGPEFSRNLHRALEQVINACTASASCSRAFPVLADEWLAYRKLPVAELRALTLPHPRNNEVLSFEVNRETLDGALRLLSYSSDTQVIIPLLLHLTMAGDWQPLVSQALQVAASLEQEISMGMHNSVVCSEDVPFYGKLPPVSQNLLSRLPHQLQQLCAIWPAAETGRPQRAVEPVQVPALLLSGERDPVTPAAYGDRVLQQFPRGLHLVIPGQAHNVLSRGCVPSLVAEFLDELELAAGDVECISETPVLPFFIDLLGPAA